jgi:hypothetical protein
MEGEKKLAIITGTSNNVFGGANWDLSLVFSVPYVYCKSNLEAIMLRWAGEGGGEVGNHPPPGFPC